MDVIVIGGGASGLVAAIKARELGHNVTILERNNKCGKKLLLTGNGKCNFWNNIQTIDKYHSANLNLFENILNNKKDKVINFFNDLGVVEKNINGYFYPFTNQSITILNALLYRIEKLNIKIIYNELVTNINFKDKFIINTNMNKYICDRVILSVGSKSYSKTGSDGSGYKLLKNFGHNINEVLPSLVPIIGKENFYKEIEGVRSDVILSLRENNVIIKEERGEVQFNKTGLSGICTFNLSGLISRGLNNSKKEEILINFVPWFNGNKIEFIKWLDKKDKRYKLSELLDGFLNYKIGNLIIKLSKNTLDSYWEEVDKERIVDLIMSFKIEVRDTLSYENAQVCSGGVYLNEIDTNTMESLKVKGLYVTGELLDVDGDCGGYNLGIAWMTGLIAGESIK